MRGIGADTLDSLQNQRGFVIELTQLGDHGRAYELRSNQYSEQGASRNAYAAAAITGGTGDGAIIGAIVGEERGRPSEP